MRRTLFYDLCVAVCAALFIFDSFICTFCMTGIGPWWGPLIHTVIMGLVIRIAYRVAQDAVKLRIQDFLVFGLLVTAACIAYFSVIYRYAVAMDPTSLLSADKIILDELPYAGGYYTLYFSVTTFFSVGNGDFLPRTPLTMLVASAEALSGYAMTVLLITAGLERIRGMRWGGGSYRR